MVVCETQMIGDINPFVYSHPLSPDDIIDREIDSRAIESFVPAMDIAAMTHQYVHSRLFRS